MIPKSKGNGRIAKRAIGLSMLLTLSMSGAAAPPPLRPVVEAEEEVYRYESANNGAGPMWCRGSTSLARIGDDVFASGLETLKDFKPLNNCRWTLFRRGDGDWKQIAVDSVGRTREPCPLVTFPEGQLFLSTNPTLTTDPNAYGGPARPEILEFATANLDRAHKVLRPAWEGEPKFTEHSYRSFAADGPNHELILFQNLGYTHAEWTFRDRAGQWSSQGKLKWPWGAEYDKPQPIRVCYPTVALKNGAVHFCGVSDIIEPYDKYRAYKKELTGLEWDYDFRRLFYTWSPNIATGRFEEWVEIASRDKTCGWITPGDLWVAPDGSAHIVWTERALDERLREKFFPDEKQSHALNYAVVREGKVVSRRALVLVKEGDNSKEIPMSPRFQITPENRLFVFYYVKGTDAAGKPLSENRIMEVHSDGSHDSPVRAPLRNPMDVYFTATVRGGSAPSKVLDLLGGAGRYSVNYARIRLHE